MLPMIVVGATSGVMVNQILPSMVIAIIMTVLLTIVSLLTLRKLCKICAEEKHRLGPLNCCRKKQPAIKEEPNKPTEIGLDEEEKVVEMANNARINKVVASIPSVGNDEGSLREDGIKESEPDQKQVGIPKSSKQIQLLMAADKRTHSNELFFCET